MTDHVTTPKLSIIDLEINALQQEVTEAQQRLNTYNEKIHQELVNANTTANERIKKQHEIKNAREKIGELSQEIQEINTRVHWLNQHENKKKLAAEMTEVEIDRIQSILNSKYKIFFSYWERKEWLDSNEKVKEKNKYIVTYINDFLQQHPYAAFLVQRLEDLQGQQAVHKNIPTNVPRHVLNKIEKEEKIVHEPITLADKIIASFFMVVDVFKKFIDFLDDIFSALRKLIPQLADPKILSGVIGGLGFIVHPFEAYRGFKGAYKAYKNKNIGQRKTRIVTGILTGLVGISGFSLGVILLLSLVVLTISTTAASFIAVAVLGGLTLIYAMAFVRNIYTLIQLNKLEKEAKKDYEETEKSIKPQIQQFQNLIHQLEEKKQEQKVKLITLSSGNEQDNIEIAQIKERIKKYDLAIYTAQSKIISLEKQIESKKEIYERISKKRLVRESRVAFGAIEVFGSALVVTGSILGLAALAYLSLGTLPLALLLGGAAIGFAFKVFELVDARKITVKERTFKIFGHKLFTMGGFTKEKHAITRGMRSGIVSLKNKIVNLFSSKKSFPTESTPLLTATPISTSSSTTTVRPLSRASSTSDFLRGMSGENNVLYPSLNDENEIELKILSYDQQQLRQQRQSAQLISPPEVSVTCGSVFKKIFNTIKDKFSSTSTAAYRKLA